MTACKDCPFVQGSRMAYDEDALEALASGAEPSCHMVVGADRVFAVEPPVHRCAGHDAWVNGEPGYCQP